MPAVVKLLALALGDADDAMLAEELGLLAAALGLGERDVREVVRP